VGVHDIALSKKKQWQECATNNALEMEGESGRGEVVDEEGVEGGGEWMRREWMVRVGERRREWRVGVGERRREWVVRVGERRREWKVGVGERRRKWRVGVGECMRSEWECEDG